MKVSAIGPHVTLDVYLLSWDPAWRHDTFWNEGGATATTATVQVSMYDLQYAENIFCTFIQSWMLLNVVEWQLANVPAEYQCTGRKHGRKHFM